MENIKYSVKSNMALKPDLTHRRVALIHDWLVVGGGAEKVLQSLLELFPHADLFTLVDFFPDDQRGWLKKTKVVTSFIQKLPFARSKYTHYFPLFPYAIEQFDLSGYDVVISSSYCAAKGVITGPNVVHISYCHSPARYAWDLQHQYLRESGLDKGLKSVVARYFLHHFRNWDCRSAAGPDVFIANSRFIQKRIYKCYRRESNVIYPPVNLDRFTLEVNKDDYYITASRLVPYKRVDLIVRAFAALPHLKLKVLGTGSELARVKELAKDHDNIEILGYQSDESMVRQMQKAKGFVFAAEEDFGIIALEAQACGTPVLAYGRGGSLETVNSGVSGHFFYEQTEASMIKGVQEFETLSFDPHTVRSHALGFSEQAFQHKIINTVERALQQAGQW